MVNCQCTISTVQQNAGKYHYSIRRYTVQKIHSSLYQVYQIVYSPNLVSLISVGLQDYSRPALSYAVVIFILSVTATLEKERTKKPNVTVTDNNTILRDDRNHARARVGLRRTGAQLSTTCA